MTCVRRGLFFFLPLLLQDILGYISETCPNFSKLDAERFQLQPFRQAIDPAWGEKQVDTEYLYSAAARSFYAMKASPMIGSDTVLVKYYRCDTNVAESVHDAIVAEIEEVSATGDAGKGHLIGLAKEEMQANGAELCNKIAEFEQVVPCEGRWANFAASARAGQNSPGFDHKCRIFSMEKDSEATGKMCNWSASDTGSRNYDLWKRVHGKWLHQIGEGALAGLAAKCGWLPFSQGTVLNIGAGDGEDVDPVWALVKEHNYTGVFVEASSHVYQRLLLNLRRHMDASLRPILAEARPGEHMETLLEQANMAAAGMGPDVLKIDIDSFDCDVARAALLRLSPKPRIVWIEVNWSVPPPVRFARLYHPAWAKLVSDLPAFPWTHGCSLSYAVEMMRRFGYQLAAVDYGDAVFILPSRLVRPAALSTSEECSFLNFEELGEFQAFHRQVAWLFAPIGHIREWFYRLNAEEALMTIWCNVTSYDSHVGLDHFPFVLDL